MFAVKVLATIIALQILHNSHGFPLGGIRAIGTYMGPANGLLSLISKQTRMMDETAVPATDDDKLMWKIENDTVPYIDVLNFGEMKPDESRGRSENCSSASARKPFNELVFLNKLVQSMCRRQVELH